MCRRRFVLAIHTVTKVDPMNQPISHEKQISSENEHIKMRLDALTRNYDLLDSQLSEVEGMLESNPEIIELQAIDNFEASSGSLIQRKRRRVRKPK